MEATADFPPDAASPGGARRFVRNWLSDRASADRIDTAVLLVSELVTNAVTHAASAATVAVALADGVLTVEVVDCGPGTPVLRSEIGLRERGRGLAIVNDQASAWGVVVRSGGKTVWFSLV